MLSNNGDGYTNSGYGKETSYKLRRKDVLNKE